MKTRLLAIWTAFLLGTCLAQTFDHPVFAENERIPLAILLEAFKRDANSKIFHCDYDGDDVFDVKRRWMVTGEEKTAFLNTFGEWLGAESIELVNFGGFWDMVKEWFTICSDDEAFGYLSFSLLPMEENDEEDVGRQYVRVEYIRPNEEHNADCFAWQGKVSKSVETLPQLPDGQEVCLDIYRSCVEFARCPTWCENIVRFDLKNRSDKPVRLLRATAISDFMKIKFTPCTLPPGEQTTLEVSVKPDAFSGKFVREVLLETDAPGQEFIRLPVSGIALPAVQVIPEKLPHDSTGKYMPRVIPPQVYRTGIPMPVRPGDQEVWIGELRPEETRTQSFQLIPYDKFFQLSTLEQGQQDDAVISLSPVPDGYRLDVTVCPTKIEEEVEVRCTIAIDASSFGEDDGRKAGHSGRRRLRRHLQALCQSGFACRNRFLSRISRVSREILPDSSARREEIYASLTAIYFMRSPASGAGMDSVVTSGSFLSAVWMTRRSAGR